MHQAKRLLTSIDVTSGDPGMSISALLELELADGRRLPLLDDRGWSSSGGRLAWAFTSLQSLMDTARAVVGPDEPSDGVSYEKEAAMHWDALAADACAQGVRIEGQDLAALPHDLHLSQNVLARMNRAAQCKSRTARPR